MSNLDNYLHELGRPEHRKRSSLQLLVLLGSAGLLLLAAVRYGDRSSSAADATNAGPRPVTPRGELHAEENATIELFERSSKSVVYISPLVAVRRSFFDATGTMVEGGTGSGFIWDKKGHIVTNFHVIQGASGARVTLPNNERFAAELVGVFPDKDIAVLRISAPPDELVPVPIGRSNDLRVGQSVLAIGNPFGLDFTATTGIVSALNRQIEAANGRTIQGVIQTDAAINPGNSGGPLLDSAGRLIGMNTAIVSRTGTSAGIGFAVPADIINRCVPQLIAYGKVLRPGVGAHVASDNVCERLGLKGVLIVNVPKGSAAEKAGLRATTETKDGDIDLGDIILKVGGTPTPDNDSLLNAFEKYEVGETVPLEIDRHGKTMTVPVKLQAVE